MRADAIWTFFNNVTKCRLLFLSKSDLRIFEKPGETKILTDGTVAEISFCPAGVQRAEPFVQGMQRGGSSMLGLRGAERQWRSFSTDRSEAETSPLSGQG